MHLLAASLAVIEFLEGSELVLLAPPSQDVLLTRVRYQSGLALYSSWLLQEYALCMQP